MDIQEIECKSVLVKSKLPDADYVVNPYTGCVFGCSYCYASFMGRFVGETTDNWGRYLYAKINAVAVFAEDLARLTEGDRQATILLSSVTDPYQGAEKKYRLTRGVLEHLVEEDYPGLVSVLTKSPLVLRDINLLRQLRKVEVGLTVTTTDDQISRRLEVQAPLASRRIKTLERLKAEGVPTYAFVGPLLPHFRLRPDLLEALFSQLSAAGVPEVFVEHMNLKPYIKHRLRSMLERYMPEAIELYESNSDSEREELQALVEDFLRKYRLSLRLNRVLLHGVNS